jgi:hypothetical protein
MLRTSDDEDEGEEQADSSSAAGGSSASVKYLCRTPLPVSDADLDEDTAELTRRHIKRQAARRPAHGGQSGDDFCGVGRYVFSFIFVTGQELRLHQD